MFLLWSKNDKGWIILQRLIVYADFCLCYKSPRFPCLGVQYLSDLSIVAIMDKGLCSMFRLLAYDCKLDMFFHEGCKQIESPLQFFGYGSCKVKDDIWGQPPQEFLDIKPNPSGT